MALVITDKNFEEEVLNSDLPVLVDFWATWCGPCRMLAPTLDEVAEENEGYLKYGKVDVDENPGLARQFRIMSIPTLLVFRNGKLVNKSVGVISKEEVEDLIR